MDPYFDRGRYPLRYFGNRATLNIVRQIQTRPVLINPTVTHDWLYSAIGLDKYPIHRRQYEGKSVEFSLEAALDYVRRREAENSKR
jgi:hypothetical protein